MIAGWRMLPFSDVVADETGGNIKTLQSEFLAEGAYPIVDQGKKLVAGFTDDTARLCKAEIPAIIFGDHTKCLKFIDFPFCLGADGTKVLRPKIELDLRYLFHYLQTVHIPDAGYSRHFKYLKKSYIHLPPLDEQKRIAVILDQADALRRLRHRAIDKLNTLGQSIFYEMFGDRSEGTSHMPLGKCVIDIQIGPFGSLLHKADYIEGGVPLINPMHIVSGEIVADTKFTVPDLKLQELNRYRMNVGDIVMARRGEMGRCAIVGKNEQGYICGTGSLFIRPNLDIVSAQFLKTFLSTGRTRRNLENTASGVTMLNLNSKALAQLPTPIPCINKQKLWSSILDQLRVEMKRNEDGVEKQKILFASLQQRAFKGKL